MRAYLAALAFGVGAALAVAACAAARDSGAYALTLQECIAAARLQPQGAQLAAYNACADDAGRSLPDVITMTERADASAGLDGSHE